MKTHHLVGILVCVIALGGIGLTEASACDLTIRDRDGRTIGRIDSRGAVRSSSGFLEGRIEDGTVRDANGRTIGRVSSNGSVRNTAGHSMGKITDNGTLRDSSGRSIGKIASDGAIRNSAGATRGRFAGYSPGCRHIAAAYLFFFNGIHES